MKKRTTLIAFLVAGIAQAANPFLALKNRFFKESDINRGGMVFISDEADKEAMSWEVKFARSLGCYWAINYGNKDLVEKALKFQQQGPYFLFGHGAPGLVVTGVYGEDYISNGNASQWIPLLSRMRNINFDNFTILACNTAAGPEGARLLQDMANTIGKPVIGGTGELQIYDDGTIEWEAGSQYVTKWPGRQELDSVPPPSRDYRDFTINSFVYCDEKVVYPQDIKSIKVVNYIKPGDNAKKHHSVELKEEKYGEFCSYLFGSEPICNNGKPLAIVTREIEITFYSPNSGDLEKRSFIVYNDSLVKDYKVGLYYYVRPLFSTIIDGR